MTWQTLLCACLLGSLLGGCDDPPKKNPFEPPPDQPKQPPPTTSVPTPSGPPAFEIDNLSPKVGFSRAMLDKREGKDELKTELTQNKEHISGKTVPLRVDRQAKMSWVMTFFQQLGELGAEKIEVQTETREEYPKKLAFTPLRALSTPPSCSVVTMVMDDRSTAVWKLSGGVASKLGKGMAGPDLTMTGDTIQRFAKGCKESSTIFVSAAEEIEWGLAYDLAASTTKVEKVDFDNVVLLPDFPVAGHEVELKSP